MKAGTELDALLAETVMGCKVWRQADALAAAKDQQEYERIRYFRKPFHCGCGTGRHEQFDDSSNGEGLKHYSTDNSAAWEVVKAFITGDVNGFLCHANIRYGSHSGLWSVWFAWGSERHEAQADSKSEAICIAALRSVGNDIKSIHQRQVTMRATQNKIEELESLLRTKERENYELAQELLRLKGLS